MLVLCDLLMVVLFVLLHRGHCYQSSQRISFASTTILYRGAHCVPFQQGFVAHLVKRTRQEIEVHIHIYTRIHTMQQAAAKLVVWTTLLAAVASWLVGRTAAAAEVNYNLYLYADNPLVTEFMGDIDTDFREDPGVRIVQFYSPFCVSSDND